MIPYGKQIIDEDDIAAVVQVLRSDWLTTGPKVAEFEEAFAVYCGVRHAVAVSNGTAALHCAMAVLGIGPGDRVLVPTMSFAASANCIVFQGATPVFLDVRDKNLLIDPDLIEPKITKETKGIIAVDYAGMPCDYDRLREITDRYGLFLVADACHAVGGSYKGRPVGSLADLNTFSFHPVKNMTTGEGGMITTDDDQLALKMRRFRSHGVTMDFRQRLEAGSWVYDMVDLGYNYRISDIQCALGLSQLEKLSGWVQRRNEIASAYDAAFGSMEVGEHGRETIMLVTGTTPPYPHTHGRHLYVIRVATERRAEIFGKLRDFGIGVNVHYIPIHLHPFYRERFGTGPGMCPVAEAAYEQIISLPMYPAMTDADVETVIGAVKKVLLS